MNLQMPSRPKLTPVAVMMVIACGGQGSPAAGPTRHTDGGVTASKGTPMKIRLVIDNSVVSATLDDTPVARDFAALLPLNVTLRDYAGTEKVSELPRRLSTDGAHAGVDPGQGDITYYAPWGNLAPAP